MPAEGSRLRLGGERQRQPGAASGNPRRLLGPLRSDAPFHQCLGDLVLGHPAEADGPAAAGDGDRQVVLVLGDEHEHGGRSGFLQRLEQSVGGGVGHQRGVVEHEHLAIALHRAQVCLGDGGPGLLDTQCGAALSCDHRHVGVIQPQHASDTCLAVADEGGGEVPSDQRLADGGRTAE